MLHRIALVALAAAVLGLVGCGSNDSLGLNAPLVVDLTPVALDAPLSVVTSQAFDIEVTVQNDGGIDARGFEVEAEVRTGGALLSAGSTIVTTGLSAGDVTTVTIKMGGVPIEGAYLLLVTVDPDNTITESNEFNNQITENVTFSTGGGGDPGLPIGQKPSNNG